MPQDAYLTLAQQAYWGDADSLTDIGPVVSGVDVPSEVTMVRRVVLGSQYPTADVARVAYRVALPRLRTGPESEAMRGNPKAFFALVRTDDLRAMLAEMVVGGIPQQAAAQGEITGNIQASPAGPVWRMTAVALTAGNVAVNAPAPAYAVVTNGGGNFTRDGKQFPVPKPGIVSLGFAGAAVGIPANAEGWLLHSGEAAI